MDESPAPPANQDPQAVGTAQDVAATQVGISVQNDTAAQTGTAAQATSEPSAHDTVTPGNIKILCIEDEYFIGELYERALRKAGYDVTNVLNGHDGLQVAKTNTYDVILLDLMVPGMTGIEILRALRDPAQTPQLKAKILITTNLDQREDSRAELERLADGYLIKAELTPNELAKFVATIVPPK